MKYRYYLVVFRMSCQVEGFAVRLRDWSQRRKMSIVAQQYSA
jgi:hypothetical protein